MALINNSKLLNKNLFSATTDKAVLIKVPKKEYFFWISKKFINHYEYQFSIGIIREWNYQLISNNGNKIMEVSGDDLLDLLNGSKTLKHRQIVKLELDELEN